MPSSPAAKKTAKKTTKKAAKKTVFSRSALERVVKTSSKFKRVDPDAYDALESILDGLIVKVAIEAGELARAEQRTTVLRRDVEEALGHQLGRPGTSDPQALFAALEAAPTDELGRLVNLIDAWVAQRKAQRP